MKNLQTFDSSLLISRNYFNNDGAQLFLILQRICKTIRIFCGLSDTISEWKSKGLSNEKTELPFTAIKLSPKLVWINSSRIRLRFTGSLRQESATFTQNNVANLFIVYELDRWSQDLNVKFILRDCLFGTVKLTKNANANNYFYSRYGIGFDSRSLFSIPDFDWGKNVVIFGVDMSSSVHAYDKHKGILILDKEQTKGLNDISLTAEAEYSINFSRSENFLGKVNKLGHYIIYNRY